MGRIRIIGAGRESGQFLKKVKEVIFAFASSDIPVDSTEPHIFSHLPVQENSDFRLRIKSNSRRKRFLIKSNQEKIQIKSERIRNLRKAKLERYRIDFIPLSSDEDWENMARFYSANPGKTV